MASIMGSEMDKIRRLPPELAEKIAAGEVIERPFSAVKELVENSLDAGATEIRVELQAGGKRLIKVVDNGSGMSPGDARLSIERHSTSKISTAADLERISTLGFRGEALASIAAVSELVIRTSDGSSGAGIEVSSKGGVETEVKEIAFPRGTSVEVRDLFFNLPARRKFLRSEQSELGLSVRYLTSAALAFPEVRFVLVHGRKEIINCLPVGSLRERIFELFGNDVLERLMEIDFRDGESRIFGFGSRPPEGKTDKAHQLFFVNRRPVRDRILQAALNQGYHGFLTKDLFPEAFLFLILPPEEVDVNVHPAKAEVRFGDSQRVFHLVLKGIEASRLKDRGFDSAYGSSGERSGAARVAEAPSPPTFSGGVRSETGPPELFRTYPEESKEEHYPRVLGQFLNTYIIVAGEDELLIVDQHNAHERVLFEKYREIDSAKKWPEQTPLIPVLFDLSPEKALRLEENRALLEESGFRVDPMGGRTYALNGFPDIFGAEEAKETLLALLEEIGESGAGEKRERVLATLACRSAVKANEPLSREKMDFLVQELWRVSNRLVCPHGRPIVIRIGKNEIDKGLKRTRS